MGRAHEKWHICKCLVFHAENLLKVYTQKNSGYTKSRRKIRQQKIPKIDSKFLHIELLSREAWTSKDTRFLTLSMKMLGLKGITFFVDEWEKISYNCDLQRHLSFYIDRILDDPIYCWISVVPYRGSLYSLDNGADLQHYFNLDENLVYENSKKDR